MSIMELLLMLTLAVTLVSSQRRTQRHSINNLLDNTEDRRLPTTVSNTPPDFLLPTLRAALNNLRRVSPKIYNLVFLNFYATAKIF